MPTKMETAEAAVLKARESGDKFQNAREQAQAQFESIREMVEALEDALAWEGHPDDSGEKADDARRTIQDDALSVEVRTGWFSPGAGEVQEPTEYRILLCTGGPAVQITGELNEHGEPETARLEMQDWFLPWTEYRPLDTAPSAAAHGYLDPNAEETLLTYARQFYFGE